MPAKTQLAAFSIPTCVDAHTELLCKRNSLLVSIARMGPHDSAIVRMQLGGQRSPCGWGCSKSTSEWPHLKEPLERFACFQCLSVSTGARKKHATVKTNECRRNWGARRILQELAHRRQPAKIEHSSHAGQDTGQDHWLNTALL